MLFLGGPALADPLDTVYWKTFHISSIGVRENMHAGYRQSMLTNTVGVMPENMGLPLILQGVWKSSLTSSEVPSSAAGGPSFAKASADKKNSAAPVL